MSYDHRSDSDQCLIETLKRENEIMERALERIIKAGSCSLEACTLHMLRIAKLAIIRARKA